MSISHGGSRRFESRAAQLQRFIAKGLSARRPWGISVEAIRSDIIPVYSFVADCHAEYLEVALHHSHFCGHIPFVTVKESTPPYCPAVQLDGSLSGWSGFIRPSSSHSIGRLSSDPARVIAVRPTLRPDRSHSLSTQLEEEAPVDSRIRVSRSGSTNSGVVDSAGSASHQVSTPVRKGSRWQATIGKWSLGRRHTSGNREGCRRPFVGPFDCRRRGFSPDLVLDSLQWTRVEPDQPRARPGCGLRRQAAPESQPVHPAMCVQRPAWPQCRCR
jgi:hypothetical protein